MKRKLTELASFFTISEDGMRKRRLEMLHTELSSQGFKLRAELEQIDAIEKKFKKEISSRKARILKLSRKNRDKDRQEIERLSIELIKLEDELSNLLEDVSFVEMNELMDKCLKEQDEVLTKVKELNTSYSIEFVQKKTNHSSGMLKELDQLMSEYESKLIDLESQNQKSFEKLILISDDDLAKMDSKHLNFLSRQIKLQINGLDEGSISLLEVKQELDPQFEEACKKKEEWSERNELAKNIDEVEVKEAVQMRCNLYEKSAENLETQIQELELELNHLASLKEKYNSLFERVNEQLNSRGPRNDKSEAINS